jgi:hypothetical protein
MVRAYHHVATMGFVRSHLGYKKSSKWGEVQLGEIPLIACEERLKKGHEQHLIFNLRNNLL